MTRMGIAPLLAICLFLLCLANAGLAAVVPVIDWTANYNGPDSYWDSADSGGDAALHDGFLHVAGFA